MIAQQLPSPTCAVAINLYQISAYVLYTAEKLTKVGIPASTYVRTYEDVNTTIKMTTCDGVQCISKPHPTTPYLRPAHQCCTHWRHGRQQ